MTSQQPPLPAAPKSDVEANIEALRAVFPQAFTEQSVDFDCLKRLLGGGETYGLQWPGRQEALEALAAPAQGLLIPAPDESLAPESTRNILVCGDNLPVLKLLQRQWANKVKLIYIDPPYNTGNDFVYRDNFRIGLKSYRDRTSAADSGRFHADWLSMIYPRLALARNFLTPDGIVLISIDDKELDHLTVIGREIFGDNNFCGHFVWEKKRKPSFLDAQMGRVTEYIVCFARDRTLARAFTAGSTAQAKKYPFNNAGNGLKTLTFPAGSVSFRCPDGLIPAQDMSTERIVTRLLDPVTIAGGRNKEAFRLLGEWRYSQATLEGFVARGEDIIISRVPFRPNYISRTPVPKKTTNLLSYRTNGLPTNEDAAAELRALFGADVMTYPKPSGLMAYLIDAVTSNGDLVMDFFAGSGSTAHGLWLADMAAGIRRQFILVQMPEPTRQPARLGGWKTTPAWDAGFPTIFDVTRQRLLLTARQLRAQASSNGDPEIATDLGFQVLRHHHP